MPDFLLILIESLLILNISLMLYIIFQISRMQHIQGAKVFTFIVVCTSLITLFYIMEIASDDIGNKIFWIKMKYTPFSFLPALALIFSLNYVTNRIKLPGWIYLLLFLEPFFYLFLIWFEPFPQLFTSEGAYVKDGIIDTVIWERVSFYYVHLAYSALILMITMMILLVRAINKQGREKKHYFLLMMAFSIPPTAAILEVLISFPNFYVDWPVITMSLTTLIFYYGFRTNYLFKVAPISYRMVLKNLDQGIITLDRNMLVLDINEMARNMFNLDPQRELTRKFTDVLPEYDYIVGSMKNSKKESYHTTVKDRHLNRILALKMLTIKNDKGDSIGYLFTIKNITTAEKARARLLSYSSLMAMINKVLRHDLLNDLWVTRMIVERSLEKKNTELLTSALRSMDKSKETIQRMRALEKEFLRDDDLKVFRVSEVLERIEDLDDAKVDIQGDTEVLADQGIFTVFNNLLTNAEKHGEADKIKIRIGRKETKVSVEVCDNGKGIPPGIRKTIFNEGISYGDSKGSGLGLFIVKRTMERIGGDVDLKSGENKKGTCFILTFSAPE